MHKFKSNGRSGARYAFGRDIWRVLFLLLFGFFVSKGSLLALAPIRKALALIPGGYPENFAAYSNSIGIGYLPSIGPVEIRIGEKVQPLDRMLLHALPIEEEDENDNQSIQNEAEEIPSTALNKQSLAYYFTNQADIDSTTAGAPSEIFQPVLQDEYQGNVEFVDPEEFLMYFEKDLSRGDGGDHIGVPFEVPFRSGTISPGVKSSATYNRE